MIIKEQRLTEGHGAGYTIDVEDYEVQSIDNVTIDSISPAKYNWYVSLTICGKCAGKVIANGVQAESYYYGTEKLNDVPAEFTWFDYEIDLTTYDIEDLILDDNKVKARIFKDYSEDYDSVDDVDYSDFSMEEIFNYITVEDIDTRTAVNWLKDEINGASSSINYGGGWSHCTYDGQLTDDDSLENTNVVCNMYITDNSIIEYIDKAVTGDNEYITYDIWDREDGIVESYNDKDYSLDYVIEMAKKYAEDNDIDIEDMYINKTYWSEDYEGNIDPTYDEIVWEG